MLKSKKKEAQSARQVFEESVKFRTKIVSAEQLRERNEQQQ